MSDTAKRTVADVVRDFCVWFVANGHKLLGSQVQAELVSRINYLFETEIARREAMIRLDELKNQGVEHIGGCRDGYCGTCARIAFLEAELVERPERKV